MTNKKEFIESFLNMLNNENCNQIMAENGLDEAFGKDMLFSVICNRCASMDIDIIGERGIDYGGLTGYQPGSTAIKCNSCGAALTIWE